MEFRLKTLTPIWTGGVKKNEDKLHLTGIRGSIRWWYEVLIRGLGCYACDPTASEHCELKPKELDRDASLAEQVKKKICPACYMFGCTGWSGKFILKLNDPSTNEPIQSLSERNFPFTLHFIEQKKIDPEEEILLKMTLKLIVKYGAIGGRTTLKPSENNKKNKDGIHADYGVIEWLDDISSISTSSIYKHKKENIKQYLDKFNKASKNKNDEYPDLKNFWFITGHYITREEHNQIVNRDISSGSYIKPDELQIFLGGYILKENVGLGDENASKKIFSFHGIDPKNGKCVISNITRCFGYAKGSELDKVKKLIKTKVERLEVETKKGEDVLNEL